MTDDLKDPGREAGLAFAWAGESGQIKRDAYELIRRDFKTARTLIRAGVSTWLNDLGATRHRATDAGVAAAMHAYFAGNAPFGSKRARDDLPDAFIFEVIRGFASKTEGTHAVVADGRLARALEGTKAIVVHRTWSGLLRSDAIGHADDTVFKALWSRHEKVIRDGLADALDARLDFLEVESPAFLSDNQDATITQAGTVGELDLIAGEAELLPTDDALTVPFTCDVTDNVADLYVNKGEFWAAADDRYTLTDGDWNSHVVEAQVSVDLSLRGTALISLHTKDGIASGIKAVEVADLDEITVTAPTHPDA